MLAMSGFAVLPVLQMTRLTLAKGDELAAEAEKRLISESWTETYRGRILDRKGREIARDRPSFDVLVDYSVITGRWAETQALRAARRDAESKGKTWATLSAEDKAEAAARFRPQFDEYLSRMWSEFAKLAGSPLDRIDARKTEIVEQVQYLSTIINERQKLDELERRVRAGQVADASKVNSKVIIQEQRQPHVVLRDVPDAVGFAFERVKDATTEEDDAGITLAPSGKPMPVMPGLHVRNAMRRDYPFDVVDVTVDTSVFPPPLRGGEKTVRVGGVAMHMLGRMRDKLYKEDLSRRPRVNTKTGEIDRGHYRPGDTVGQGGIEEAREDDLRGLRGMRRKHLDTGAEELTPAEPGRDLAITIDIALQARIQALFDPSLGLTVVQPWQKPLRPQVLANNAQELPIGTPLNGAVVVIDVATGDVLAAVSYPSYTHEQIEHQPGSINNDAYTATFLNRATAKPYQPGSVVKPLVLCGAIADRKYALGEHIACTGHFFRDKPTLYRCWIYKQFSTTHTARLGHDLDGAEAIKCSCNIFFFELGQRLGQQRVFDLYAAYGVGARGQAMNIFGLPDLPTDPQARLKEAQRRAAAFESPGEVRDPERATIQEAILMGIGQGPLTWTPLHAANAYATLARGSFLTPRLYMDQDQRSADVRITAEARRMALAGLYGSANEENGTTHVITYELADGQRKQESVFTAPGITVWAKSGTADTGPFKADLDQQDGRELLYDGDHSWCVALAGVGQDPKYAIACVVDYGGSGGKVSGPLANQVIYALAAEGYLPLSKPQARAGSGTDGRRN